MHYITEELARLRRCELLREAREQRLVAEAGRESRYVPAWLSRSARSRG